jgi:hypothetical protein
MAYYPDLTKYTYGHWTGGLEALNVGWLDEAMPFQTGEVPQTAIDKLSVLCSRPVVLMRGVHSCQFCHPGSGRRKPSGCGEIRVIGMDSVVYAAPALLRHYICDHRYRPPDEFLAALEGSPVEVHLTEMQRWDEF